MDLTTTAWLAGLICGLSVWHLLVLSFVAWDDIRRPWAERRTASGVQDTAETPRAVPGLGGQGSARLTLLNSEIESIRCPH